MSSCTLERPKRIWAEERAFLEYAGLRRTGIKNSSSTPQEEVEKIARPEEEVQAIERNPFDSMKKKSLHPGM